ncbi:hypothetical protein GCM10028784_29450 [Myceligenerans cantabricum]
MTTSVAVNQPAGGAHRLPRDRTTSSAGAIPLPRSPGAASMRSPSDAGRVRQGVPPRYGERTAGGEHTEGSDLDGLVRALLPGLLRYATMLVGDQHTAADLVQEVLLRAHVRWERIALMDRPDLYLRRMVTNEHLSWRRRWHVRTIRPAADDVLATHAGQERDPAQGVADGDAMWKLLADLPRRQRTVLVLRYYESLSDPEIAAVLGTTAVTVRSHASRALATLRRVLPESMETR